MSIVNKLHLIFIVCLSMLAMGCMKETLMDITLDSNLASTPNAASPTISLTGLPSDPSNAALSITVSGSGVNQYAYDIINQAANCSTATYSAWTSLTVQIVEAVVDGAYRICVKGRSSSAVETSITEYTWTQDTDNPEFIFELRNQTSGSSTTTDSLNVNAAVTNSTGTPSHYCFQLSSSTPSVSAGCWATGTTQAITLATTTSTVYGWARDAAGNISASSSDTIFYFVGNCPLHYVPVPGNTDLGTNSFCVMTYEAKNNGSSVAVSTSTGFPWGGLDLNNAWAECDDLNSEALRADKDNDTNGDGTYALLSNREWMTIARNAENVGSNWSGAGGVGDGSLPLGWVSSITGAWTNNGLSALADPSCLYNTNTNACAATGSHIYRRTHTLSNGSEIWDMSGNAWEWVNWNTGGTVALGPTSCNGAWIELPSVACGALLDEDYNTSNGTFDSTQGTGRFLGGTGGAALRGTRLDYGSNAGLFALSLGTGPTFSDSSISFRCRYSP